MEPIYVKNIAIDASYVDRFGRMKPSMILYLAQEMGGAHCTLLSLDYDTLAGRHMFWAVTRHRVQITRLPHLGETIRVETWPLPPTRAAYPRSVVAYGEDGGECFRAMTLWVLMNLDTRKMILPGKSGISIPGTLRGNELPAPNGLIPRVTGDVQTRRVAFSDLDRNGHMNNTRCMDWISDLLPSDFHRVHNVKEFTVCYLTEAREQEMLELRWELPEDGALQVDAYCGSGDDSRRVFSAKVQFEADGVL